MLVLAAFLTGCAEIPIPTSEHIDGTESMPSPASVWLTADPAAPGQRVKVEMITPDLEFHREHIFEAGETLRGSFPVSEGRYRLIGLEGECVLDLQLGPEREADVVIRVDGIGGCEFAVVSVHGYGGVMHPEPEVLVAPSP
jgi:hypothetical protein